MEVDEGDDGYGFARRNHPVRKKIGRRAAVHSSTPGAPAAYGPGSQKPAWVWLLIGFLLGAGGTLLTASFWLPESGERHIATRETDDHPSQRSAISKASSEPLELETEIPGIPPNGPGPEATSIAASNIERQMVSPNGNESPRSPDDVRYDAPPPPQNADAPDTVAKLEAQRPAVAIDADNDADQRPPGSRRAASLSDPGEELAALVSEATPTETPELASPPDGSDLERPDQADSTPTQPESPVPAETPTERPTAALPDDESQQDAGPRSTVTEAVPPNGTSRRELPPRIRQALLAARATSATGVNGGNGGRLYRVQLAAVDNEAAARIFWREANERLPGIFADVEPIFDQRLVDERLFLRVWVGAFDNRLDADGYCGWLKLQGQDCFVTRVDNL